MCCMNGMNRCGTVFGGIGVFRTCGNGIQLPDFTGCGNCTTGCGCSGGGGSPARCG